MPAADLGQVNSYEIPVVSPENSFHKRIAWRAPIYLFKRDTLRSACIALDNMLNMQWLWQTHEFVFLESQAIRENVDTFYPMAECSIFQAAIFWAKVKAASG